MEKFFDLMLPLMMVGTMLVLVFLMMRFIGFWVSALMLLFGLMLLVLGFDFLGLLWILIYVGALVVLFMFVIMYVNIGEESCIRGRIDGYC